MRQRMEGDTKFCTICHIHVNPEFDQHCDDCGVCVRGYDHHCIFYGKCVGEGNFRSFQTTLVLPVFTTIVTFAMYGYVVFAS